MATPPEETKLFKPFLPPLQLCASAKIALQLRQEFGHRALEVALEDIQRGNLTTAEGVNDKIRRAKESLLHIPAHLRRGVMDAVYGSLVTVIYWRWYYASHFEFKEVERSFQFRSDGTVDAVKTAQGLVRSEKLDIRQRFKLACVFSLEVSVEALWAEMEAAGETKDLETTDEFIVGFWVGWLRERPLGHPLGPLDPSSLTSDDPRVKVPRCSAFLPLLRLEDRQKCLHLLLATSWEDFRFSVHHITRKEEEELLRKGQAAFRLLRPHLLWPLQTTFLPTVAKLWDYMDDISFRKLLHVILTLRVILKDFNYSQLFVGFWNASPLHLKESALGEPELRQKIDSFFDEKRRKRKYAED